MKDKIPTPRPEPLQAASRRTAARGAIRDIFRRKGAYAHFKNLLARRGALDAWHEFEAKAQKQAQKQWCDDNAIELIED
ncbi:hypothetical protein [Methylosinus sp. Sm6]|uniref:hypothetical protein n=1 Tax=Methylosinus sp. Sm6 TaxID=2866948 RepID=UPI001C996ACF|nr:hypothetical protein [Methylosinus sp. Sm6]MBY6241167.1 hypothetical protein [Methylosinus sp. Sm6]